MPFTLAHPAAALPLARPLGRRAVRSALVIGSLMPDAPYLLGLEVPRATSHGVPGLFTICLPLGLACWLLFHLVLKHPFVALLPRPVQLRLAPHLGPIGRLPDAAWSAVAISLLAGAASHVAWDAVTHLSSPLVQGTPWLRATLLSVHGYPILTYKVLQNVSTVVGLGLLVFWAVRWLRTAPCAASSTLPRLSGGARAASLAVLAMLTGIAAVLGAASALDAAYALAPALDIWTLRDMLRSAVVSGLSGLIASLVLFGALWHARVLAFGARA
jgi:hypothetical protein